MPAVTTAEVTACGGKEVVTMGKKCTRKAKGRKKQKLITTPVLTKIALVISIVKGLAELLIEISKLF
jgi:hypothetical protein